MGMVYDAARRQVLLFGGCGGGSPCLLGDTWTWDGMTWTEQHPATSPPARAHIGMAYDASRRQVLLFGGAPVFGDTWTWDGLNWTKQDPATSPVPRRDMGMAYDAVEGQTVLFGGFRMSRPHIFVYGDTWEWDGLAWTQRAPGTSPSPRYGAGMAYDAARRQVLLFGGTDGSFSLGDTWTWDGTTWTQQG
jgi:hypothetical protein